MQQLTTQSVLLVEREIYLIHDALTQVEWVDKYNQFYNQLKQQIERIKLPGQNSILINPRDLRSLVQLLNVFKSNNNLDSDQYRALIQLSDMLERFSITGVCLIVQT